MNFVFAFCSQPFERWRSSDHFGLCPCEELAHFGLCPCLEMAFPASLKATSECVTDVIVFVAVGVDIGGAPASRLGH